MTTSVRQAFRDQARYCEALGSPFTARVCRLCAERLDDSIPVARTILGWRGDPTAHGDSVPLRLAGALHYLARGADARGLGQLYPPAPAGDDTLWPAIRAALVEHEDLIRGYLDSAPQTNEVMRSAALLPGLLEVAARTRLPLALYEIGASAGLNLILDRYRYRFGSATWGDARARVLLEPQWRGPPPQTEAPWGIASRQGVDLNPVDITSPEARDRLLSYVWPDQRERFDRLERAMAAWLAAPEPIARGDAAAWLEDSSLRQALPGVARALFHSVAWSYFPDAVQQRIEALLRDAGAHATAMAPLAWLRFELAEQRAELRLTLWPGGDDELLARAHPHGSMVEWRPDPRR